MNQEVLFVCAIRKVGVLFSIDSILEVSVVLKREIAEEPTLCNAGFSDVAHFEKTRRSVFYVPKERLGL